MKIRAKTGMIWLLALTTVSLGLTQPQVLPFYLSAARANSSLVRENQRLSDVAELEVAKAKAANQLPEVSIGADYLYAPVFNGVGYDAAITNGALYAAQVRAVQPMFTRPKVAAQERNSAISQEIYRRQSELALHDLDRQVTEQYILTWQNLERQAGNQRVFDILDEQEKVIRAFVRSGILSQSDLLFFNIEKENLQLAQQDLEMAYRQGLSELNRLCGRVDTAYVALQQPQIGEPGDTVGASRFLGIWRLDSLQVQSDQEISELKYRPQTEAFADYGLNAVMLRSVYKNFGFSLGLRFSMPLYDGHQRDITRQQTRLRQQAIGDNRKYQADQVLQQRLAARQQIDMLDAKIRSAQKQLSDYEELLRFYRARIAQGELSVNDYINTLRSFAAAQADFIALETSRLLLLNNYNYWNW